MRRSKSFFEALNIRLVKKSEIVSEASIDNLAELAFPKDLNLDKNSDLIPFAADAAVVNMLNKNGDAIDTETAIAIADLFNHKPVNVEHNKKQVVGHIVCTGWQSHGESELLETEAIANTKEPFNLVLGAVNYVIVDKDLSKILLQSDDEDSNVFAAISMSWELTATDFDIVLGGPYLKDAKIISDPKEKLKYKKYLRKYKGSGKLPDGTLVGRLLKGEVSPRGVALTLNPAAKVKGVKVLDEVVIEDDDEDEENENEENEEINDSASIQPDEKGQKTQEENSEASTKIEEKQENSVINQTILNNNKDMSLKEILKSKLATEADIEIVEASVKEEVEKCIASAAEAWDEKVNAAKREKEEVQAKLNEITASLTEKETLIANLQEAINQSNAQCETLMKSMAAEKQEKDFNDRMSCLASEFNLDTDDCSVIAKQIKGLDEESYAAWYGDFSVVARGKKKCVEANASIEKPEVKPETKTVEEVLASAKMETQSVPNAGSTEEPSFKDKFKDAFKVSITK